MITTLAFQTMSNAQNCGNVSSWDYTPTATGYDINVQIQNSTGGGNKGVSFTILCNGSVIFTQACTTTRTVATISASIATPICGSTLTLEWVGGTSSGNCGGGSNCTGTSTPIVLPVKLISFTGSYSETGIVTLNWKTASEKNNQGFEIQKSTNGTEWSTTGWEEGNGSTVTVSNYSVLFANNSNQAYYYRLKQIDFDGQFEYSSVIKLVKDSELNTEQGVYPNPSQGVLHLTTPSIYTEVLSIDGQVVLKLDKETSTLDLTSLKEGVYYIKTMSENNTHSTVKVVKT